MDMLNLKCEFCELGVLTLDTINTMENFTESDLFTHKDAIVYVDKTLDRPMVYTCDTCGANIKYTIKDVLRKQRDQLLQQVLDQVMVHRVYNNGTSQGLPHILIYCGRCTGQDGKGSCRPEIYNKCDLKEFPSG
jgi:hypothetical protein